ncbi:MAG TPA: hypothetical protein VEW71_03675 [Allosphingosinicella sp.]|nr:hypothetical protein [Allosphingosinicella sp.]
MRATSAAAAAPNSRIIGGAGTWVPPVELDEPPDDEPELLAELDALVLDEEELEPLVLPEEPKLDDPPVAPELVEVDAPELVEVDAPELVDDVLVDAPELVELVEAPLELELELPWLDDPWLDEPWLDEPWLDEPWLDEPWLELPLLEEPWLDDPLDPF